MITRVCAPPPPERQLTLARTRGPPPKRATAVVRMQLDAPPVVVPVYVPAGQSVRLTPSINWQTFSALMHTYAPRLRIHVPEQSCPVPSLY